MYSLHNTLLNKLYICWMLELQGIILVGEHVLRTTSVNYLMILFKYRKKTKSENTAWKLQNHSKCMNSKIAKIIQLKLTEWITCDGWCYLEIKPPILSLIVEILVILISSVRYHSSVIIIIYLFHNCSEFTLYNMTEIDLNGSLSFHKLSSVFFRVQIFTNGNNNISEYLLWIRHCDNSFHSFI